MAHKGIRIPTTGHVVGFTTPLALDMRGYKERRLVWSYVVVDANDGRPLEEG